jgi:hypothetical protein
VTGADEDIIEPIDYPMTLRPKQYKAARQAVDLIEPVERNQTPKIHALNYEITILASGTRSARDACRMDVEAALWDIGLALYIEDFYSFGVTKADKGKARQIARALRRVDDLVRDFNKRDFPLNRFPFDELTKWKKVFTKMAGTPSRKTTRQNALKKRLAVAEAYQLLKKYGSERVTATKSGKFCRLAALLYGDPKADLINQCRAYKRAPTRTAAEYTEQTRVQRIAEGGEKSGAK